MQASVPDLDRDLYQNIGYLIRRTHQIADALFESEMRELGLTPVQFGILVAVSIHEGIDQFQLGQAIGFDRTTISYVVRKLAAKNLIGKFKDAADKRSNLLALTPHGQEVLRQAQPLAAGTSNMFLAELSDDERETLRRLLNKIVYAHDAQGAKPRISFNRRAALTAGDSQAEGA